MENTAVLWARTAIVTGGAGGIGRAVSEALAAQGAAVTVLDRDAERAEEVADAIGGRAVVIDLADPAAVAALDLDADILINNAGIQHVAPIEEFPPEIFALIHRLMLEVPFLLTRAVLPGMYRRGWGRIVHVSSVHGHRGSAYKSAYVSAKHGLEGLSKVIALEAASKGVTSNTVCPGYVRTPLVEDQVRAQAELHCLPEDRVVDEVLLQRSASKRLVEPAEVAELVTFLCGPHSASMTGGSYLLDGAWTAS